MMMEWACETCAIKLEERASEGNAANGRHLSTHTPPIDGTEDDERCWRAKGKMRASLKAEDDTPRDTKPLTEPRERISESDP